MALGENIEALRLANEHSYADIARAVGTDAQQIHFLVKNNSARSKFAPAIAAYYAVDLALLFTGTPEEVLEAARSRLPSKAEARSAPSPNSGLGGTRGTPVVGVARLGDGGLYVLEEGDSIDGYLQYDGGPEAYAFYCKGDSMRSRIKPGDYMIVQPRKRVEIGDTVSCETVDGRRMIKILSKRRDGMTELTSVNEDFKTITLDKEEIAHLHYAFGPIPADFYQPNLG